MARTKTRRKASIGILFWIAFILLLLVIFLFSRSNIERVLENTGLVEFINDRFGGGDEATDGGSSGEADPSGVADPAEPPPSGDSPGPREPSEPEPEADSIVEVRVDEVEPDPVVDETPDEVVDGIAGGSQTPDETPAETPTETEKPNLRNATVYLIRVTDDGKIHTEGVLRRIYFDASPMTETLNSLLGSPNREELNAGLLNLIPDGTRLLSARVQNGVAELNFSEEFRFNPMGVEGLIAQLKQIVYTTTEFSTVQAVQILIGGQSVTYLGSEGLRIDRPLSRDSFS